jgi:hypothetical protein
MNCAANPSPVLICGDYTHTNRPTIRLQISDRVSVDMMTPEHL